MSDFQVPLTRSDAVAKQLRQEILDGSLPPGTTLKDAEIGARMGVSITPVREAIAQLAVEGLVDISPNRRRTVSGLSQKTALELVDVMELLACAGFEQGMENLSAGDLAAMRDRLTEFTEALDAGDVASAGRAGADFSTIAILASGNRELQALVDLVVVRTLRMLALTPSSDAWRPWRRGYSEVMELLEAARLPEALARYRQIYAEYRTTLEHLLWPEEATGGETPHP